MDSLARFPRKRSSVSGLIGTAEQVLLCQRNQDLMEKVTVLKAYFELSQMSPERDYGPVLRRATRELMAALRVPARQDGINAGWLQ